MRKTKPLPSQERLQELFIYDPNLGLFYWKKPTSNRVKVGSIAGFSAPDGYTHIRVDGKLHRAHRLAWVYMTGSEPKDLIDHINGERTDNRFSNLREATDRQNLNNTIQSTQNLCVRRAHATARWSCRVGGKHIGSFDCPLIARLAYEDAHAELHQEYSPYYKQLNQ